MSGGKAFVLHLEKYKLDTKELFKKIAEVNPERLEAYHRMFDRILLYTIAVNTIPSEHIEKIIKNADTIVKKTIDIDSNKLQTILHGTKEGRLARIKEQKDQYDGESVRLEYIKVWELVKEIVRGNLKQPEED